MIGAIRTSVGVKCALGNAVRQNEIQTAEPAGPETSAFETDIGMHLILLSGK
jgi:hypothetical protein